MTNPYNKGKGRAIAWIRQHAHHRGTDCLIWPYSRDHVGFAMLGYRGRRYRARVLMCEEAHGPRPSKSRYACFTCFGGDRGCVNPQHIAWLTHAERMTIKGTKTTGARGRGRLHKLTEADIIEIKTSPEHQTVLADRLGVQQGTISKVRRGETWRTGRMIVGRHLVKRSTFYVPPKVSIIRLPAVRSGVLALDDFAHCRSIVPQQIPGYEDIVSMMMLALLEGTHTRETLDWRVFGRTYRGENIEQGGYALPIIETEWLDNVLAGTAVRL